MSAVWSLFPYPTLTDAGFTSGSLLDVHKDCSTCPLRECLGAAPSSSEVELKICRFGLTYARVSDDRSVVGLVASDLPNPTSKARKRIRSERSRLVVASKLRSAVSAAIALGPGVVSEYEGAKAAALDELRRDPAMQKAVAEQLRRDADQDLSQSHDFMQMVKRVKSYAEALLAARMPGVPPEEAAEKLHDEGAIYFASQLMLFKMNSLQFISEVNRAAGSEWNFRVHALLLQYKRIYEWTAAQKGLTIRQSGTYRVARYNGEAIGTMVKALLDNMVKYAPARSTAYIDFQEQEGIITVLFRSLGPKIEPEELGNIFLLKVRAKAARRAESSGQGVGLAAVKAISDALGLGASCVQESQADRDFPDRYMTTFSFRLLTTPPA